MNQRQQQLQYWVEQSLGKQGKSLKGSLSIVSGDASFRRYFRGQTEEGKTVIAVDAPPEKENSEPFIRIASDWRKQGLSVPSVLASDLNLGFMMLEDFGDRQFAHELAEHKQTRYQAAIDLLVNLQTSANGEILPIYDEALLLREMTLFTDWLIERQMSISLTPKQKAMFDDAFQILINNAMSQPQVAVHRDYHSRNLMMLSDDQIGMIDFQDAVHGPITYDLVSLLRDCYVRWDDKDVQEWLAYYIQQAQIKGLLVNHDDQEIKTWFDLMGVQRHLKAAGIFARLSRRDGKHGYLNDIPNTVQYIRDVLVNYQDIAELAELNQFINEHMPAEHLVFTAHAEEA